MNKYFSKLALLLFLAFSSANIFISQSHAQGEHDHGHDEAEEDGKHEEEDNHDEHEGGSTTISEEVESDKHDNEVDEHEEHGEEHEESSTTISDESAKKSGIETQKSGSQIIYSSVTLTGKIILNQDNTYDIKARFPGIVRSVKVKWGQKVSQGQVLATIESNDSLKLYSVKSPRKGVVLKRNTNIGNVASDEPLFTIADLSSVWAEFHVFPRDIHIVEEGQKVSVRTLENGTKDEGEITMMLPTADSESQTVIAIVSLSNNESKWRPGMSVSGKVQILEKKAPIAINKSAIQRMENETVIFVKEENNKYEARHVKLGKGDGEYIEVIEGLKEGEEYVSQGSFIIKADILKSTASHSH